jgi:hypothetical protein
LDLFVELMKGLLYAGIAVAFFLLAWAFLRLARIFSTTEKSIRDVSEQVVPLIGKTHTTVDNINSQLSQLDEAVGDVAGMTDELDQTTTVITRGVRGGVIKVSSATAGLSRGISTFLTGEKRPTGRRNEHLGQGGRRRGPRRGRDHLRHERGGPQEPAEDGARPARERAPPLRERGLRRPRGLVLPQGGDPARTPAARQGPLRAGRRLAQAAPIETPPAPAGETTVAAPETPEA